MPATIDPKRWTEGFQEAYRGLLPRPAGDDDYSYAAGRVEGEALRLKHQQEYEQSLFEGHRAGRRMRAVSKDPQ